MRHASGRWILFVLSIPAWAGVARAQWVPDIGDKNVVCTAATDQANARAIPDGRGGVFIAWEDPRANPGFSETDLYAQHVTGAGILSWAANGVPVCVAAGYQNAVSLVADGQGGIFVVWTDERTPGDADIYAQHLTSGGTATWTTDGLPVCAASGIQADAAAVPDGAGGVVIAWRDFRTGPGGDIYVQRLDSTGAPAWTPNGIPLCTAVDVQALPAIVSDGAGGAIVAWRDSRLGSQSDVYAARITAAGTIPWTADGVALCTASGDQSGPKLVTDASGGAIAVWEDRRSGVYDLYAQRISAAGTALWATDGVVVCNATLDQLGPSIAADGAGGAVIAWQDNRTGTPDIYAQRIGPGGTSLWAANGVAVCSAANSQYEPSVIGTAAHGGIVAWTDLRGGANGDIYAQGLDANGGAMWGANGTPVCQDGADKFSPRVVDDQRDGAIVTWLDGRYTGQVPDLIDVACNRIARFGVVGHPDPVIVSAGDWPGDEGGHVRLQWDASDHDYGPGTDISAYNAWRRLTTSLAAQRIARGARVLAPGEPLPATALPGATLRTSVDGAQTQVWEYLGSVATTGSAQYVYSAPTLQDSVTGSNPLSMYRLDAQAANAIPFWVSLPESAYSVDNLPPAAPTPLAWTWEGSAVRLHWPPNPASDFALFHLHLSTTPGFTPGPGTLNYSGTDTTSLQSPQVRYYKISAFDRHGNESAFTSLTLPDLLSVEGSSAVTWLAPAAPNPIRVRGSLRFSLASAAHVRLALFDLAGRRVRLLADGALDAGPHLREWDGRDDSGHALPSGIYACVLDVGASRFVRRVGVLR